MRVGQRSEFRNLRCVSRFVREARLRDGTEITRWHYQFAGTDGRRYEYRGKYLHQIEPGCYWDCLATIGYIRGSYVSLKRPKTLEPIATLKLI